MTLLIHATANRPGAIAIIQLIDDDLTVLRRLTQVDDWPLHRLRLVDFADIDQGIAVRITPAITQLMPHGGPRVVQRLISRLMELGAQLISPAALSSRSRDLYPEAEDEFESLMLLALAQAESPLAVDLLLDQPRRWRELRDSGRDLAPADIERSDRLNRLINPSVVVLVGPPNVGKSTLSNALLGRSMSITADLPGTTRDYVAGRMDLAGLVVDWHDTPGIRDSDDAIERRAIEVSRRLIDRADLLVAMRDDSSDWPTLPRAPDMRIVNKVDLAPASGEHADAIAVSAETGKGLREFVSSLRAALVPADDLEHPGPWLFDEHLRSVSRGSRGASPRRQV